MGRLTFLDTKNGVDFNPRNPTLELQLISRTRTARTDRRTVRTVDSDNGLELPDDVSQGRLFTSFASDRI
ncbi:hypothetical protein J6590_000294 [Homalodisca vitripennis]|nr:hypothetical protein J6590_000294 [Homalodisca vitripennis]